jgi:hypothetical protein
MLINITLVMLIMQNILKNIYFHMFLYKEIIIVQFEIIYLLNTNTTLLSSNFFYL